MQRYGRSARAFAALMIIVSLLPLELVWCMDGGSSAPRLEPSLAGQCLPQAGHGCCSQLPGSIAAHNEDGASWPVTLHEDHSHCFGCIDEGAVVAQHILRGCTQAAPKAPAGGYLFTVSSRGIPLPALADILPDMAFLQGHPPGAALLLAETTILLL